MTLSVEAAKKVEVHDPLPTRPRQQGIETGLFFRWDSVGTNDCIWDGVSMTSAQHQQCRSAHDAKTLRLVSTPPHVRSSLYRSVLWKEKPRPGHCFDVPSSMTMGYHLSAQRSDTVVGCSQCSGIIAPWTFKEAIRNIAMVNGASTRRSTIAYEKQYQV
jgi:hypothetical protein